MLEESSQAQLDLAMDEYASLEHEIFRALPACFRERCARCGAAGDGCCRPYIGADAIETWWFRAVSSRAHGRWWPDDYETAESCPAMGPEGCKLTAGRPLICSSFFCDELMDATSDPWELSAFAFLSDLPGWTLQVGGRTNVALFDSEEQVGPVLERLRERVRLARELVRLCGALTDPLGDDRLKHSVALRLACHNPRHLRPMVRRRLLRLLEASED